MRTKTILAAAAFIAAGALYSTAQSNVYSLNIVGYVNVQLEANKLALLSNPLKPTGGDYDIGNVLALQDGSEDSVVYRWDEGSSSWAAAYWVDGFGWDDSADLSLGKGFFVSSTINQTVTFVGEVETGTSVNVIAPGLTLLGSKIPVSGPVPGSTVGHEDDAIFTWDGSSWNASYYIDGFGWDSDSVEGPAVGVAGGFFYQNGGSALNWTTTLNP